MQIRVLPLGAGQDVGRSCIVVSLGGKNIMFDCGMHMGYQDARRFPNFKLIAPNGDYARFIDAVIISHFHLDHCGALPFFTEMCGYDGPIYMTVPTKAICPILLEDYRKITVDRRGETDFFTSAMIKDCMKKVVAVNLHEVVRVDDGLEIKAHYAGHVLGAAMFEVRAGGQSCVYTGDFNMSADRHLGSAAIERVSPDVLITETTYATTIRDSKRSRERDFLKQVHDCVVNGGKCLIPVFALGRAQELCILLDSFWERMNLKHVPIYFSAGLTARANQYYKLFINWTNEKIKETFVQRNMFDFAHIRPFDKALIRAPGPMVLFATPGMLHAGTSLEVFREWAGSEKNLTILPGYCVSGTIGNKILSGKKRVEINRKMVDIRCGVKYLSFSAHADQRGILQLIRQANPRNVVLVHGEKGKMQFLKTKIAEQFGLPCFDPANGQTINIDTRADVPVRIDAAVVDRARHLVAETMTGAAGKRPRDADGGDDAGADGPPPATKAKTARTDGHAAATPRPIANVAVQGVAVMDGTSVRVLARDDAVRELGLGAMRHKVELDAVVESAAWPAGGAAALHKQLAAVLPDAVADADGRTLRHHSLALTAGKSGAAVHVSWTYDDDDAAQRVIAALKS